MAVVQANSDIEGLLPIIDFCLPDKISDILPWYAMPVAQPLENRLYQNNYETTIQLILKIGEILVKLHERKICHRDIKPANILVMDGRFYLSDFGLVDYPEKSDLTSTGEPIGAKWTMAPEMRRNNKEADGKPADVYSLAKTLWILISDRKDGFDGQYTSESINGLSRLKLTEGGDQVSYYKEPLYIKPLDDLLRASTDNDPLQRPTISQFVEQLSSWVETYRDFRRRISLQWQDVQTKLFPTALPQRAIWRNITDIVKILNYVGSVNSLNHMLLPGRGGMDFLGGQSGLEPGTIELIINDRTVYIVKPKRLVFESFDFDFNWEWNYFRLESGDLEATGINKVYQSYEYLFEIAPLQYISDVDWDRDRDEERQYSADSRRVFRYINGSFLILQKTAPYNRTAYTYDGRHNQMGTDEFRDYISNKVKIFQEMPQGEQLATLAAEKGLTIDEVISGYLDEMFKPESLKRFPQKSRHKG